MNKTTAEVPSYIKGRTTTVTADKLKAIRDASKRMQAVKLAIEDAEDRRKELSVELYELERKGLPDLLNEAGLSSITVEPEGNQPGFTLTKSPYYKANIAASWDEERKNAAFEWLNKNGGGNLIKTEIVIRLPMKSGKLRTQVVAALRKLKVDFTIDPAVPWASLTAFVKECYERNKRIKVPLDVLGADVGEIVKLKERSSQGG